MLCRFWKKRILKSINVSIPLIGQIWESLGRWCRGMRCWPLTPGPRAHCHSLYFRAADSSGKCVQYCNMNTYSSNTRRGIQCNFTFRWINSIIAWSVVAHVLSPYYCKINTSCSSYSYYMISMNCNFIFLLIDTIIIMIVLWMLMFCHHQSYMCYP
jgi:hypothetical protein